MNVFDSEPEKPEKQAPEPNSRHPTPEQQAQRDVDGCAACSIILFGLLVFVLTFSYFWDFINGVT